MSGTIFATPSGAAIILASAIQGPAGSLASPTGTGYIHVTAGTIDGAAQAVNLAGGSTYVTGVLPMANMAAPTGTGVALVTAGAMNAAAGPIPLGGGASYVSGLLPVANVAPAGTNGYVLTTTGGVSVWAAATGITALTGDVSASGTGSVAATVNAVHGATVPAAGALTTGNVLQVTGVSALGYAAVNLAGGANYVTGILPAGNQAAQSLAGDATGTTAAVVVTQAQSGALTFASGTGLITAASADTAPGILHASTAGATGANLTLTPQASTNANGNPGSLVVALAAPTGASTAEASLTVTRAGSAVAALGAYPTYPAYGALWFGPTKGATNWGQIGDGATFTQINAPTTSSTTYFSAGGSPVAVLSPSGLTLGVSAALGGGVGGTFGITSGTTSVTSGVSTGSIIQSYSNNLNLWAPWATNLAGNVNVQLGATGTGTTPLFQVYQGGAVQAALGHYSTSYAGLYLNGQTSPSFYGDGATFSYVSGPTNVGLLIAGAYFPIYAGSTYVELNGSAMNSSYGGTGAVNITNGTAMTSAPSGGATIQALSGSLAVTPAGNTTPAVLVGSAGSGAGVLSINKATTNPSTSVTGSVLYADSSSGALCVYAPSDTSTTGPTLSVGHGTWNGPLVGSLIISQPNATAVGGTGALLLIQAQANTTAAGNGGSVQIVAGAGAASTLGQIYLTSSQLNIGSLTYTTQSINLTANSGGTVNFGFLSPTSVGPGATLNIVGMQTTLAASTGGSINITAGAGTTTGGAVTIKGGTGATNGGALLTDGGGVAVLGINGSGALTVTGIALAASGTTVTGGGAIPALCKYLPITIGGTAYKLVVVLP